MAIVSTIAMARMPAWAACMEFLILPRESNWSFIVEQYEMRKRRAAQSIYKGKRLLVGWDAAEV